MDTKICSMCNIEKHIKDFYRKIQNADTVTVQED